MPTTTRRMSAEERREQLLDVLADILVAEGYAAISIDRVARDAGIARTVVYTHFGNLEGLIEALVDRTERRALAQVRGIIPDLDIDDDPDVLLPEATRAFLTLVSEDPRTWRLAVLPVEGARTELRDRIAHAKGAVLQLLTPVMAWGLQRRGGPEGVDPELFARMLITTAEDAARLVLSQPDRFSPDDFADFVAVLMRSLARA